MNKTYRLVWKESISAWVAVAEIVKARGKRASRALLLAGMTVAALPATTFAQPPPAPTELPTGGQVVAGQAGIAQSGATMNITQSTARATIDWQTFNVGSSATVNFNQPSSSAVTLNRVLSSNSSQIFGQINANGQIFLSNPGGVYFAPGASVNVGGLVATTHGITNDDFMAGNYRFTRNGTTGSVVNEGTLTAELNGYIALLAPEVRNHGVVIAQMGTVALAAGEAYELQFAGSNTLAGIQVEPTTLAALVENGNAVQAPGGLVILSARAADQLQGSVVKNSGAIEAKGLVEKGGRIVLEGDHIMLAGDSRLDASGETGGGEVLVGGGWQGSGGMYQATTVTMAHGATIDVSATQVGAGGTAVLWSDIHNPDSQTRAHGTIWAKGGAEGGDGGRIETSGHWLDIAGSQGGASATNGKAGEWLLDPYNVTITSANANGSFGSAGGTDTWTPDADNSTILNTDINSKLDGGTNVTITTTGGGAQDGDITVAANITKSAGGDATLTLKAHNNIILNTGISISSNNGKLNTIFWADSDSDANGGYISLGNGSAITTNGGGLWMGGGSGTASWTPYDGGSALTVGNGAALGTGANNGIWFDRAVMNTGVGNVKIVGQGANAYGIWTNIISGIAGSITTTSGNVSITGTSTNSMGMIYRDTVTTGTGTIEVIGTGSHATHGGIYLENGKFLIQLCQ